MPATLASLEAKRTQLYQELSALGDFRRGTISVNFRRCGKRNCACAQPGHPGHGPQYLWNATIGGKSRARNLRLGPEVEKVAREVETYRTFVHLCADLVAVNEQLCDRRPLPAVAEAPALEALRLPVRRNVGDLFRQPAFRMPKVECLLEPQPKPRPVAAEFPQSDGHVRRHGRPAGQNPVQHLSAHPELPRRIAHGQAKRRQDVFPQNGAGVRRGALQPPVPFRGLHHRTSP